MLLLSFLLFPKVIIRQVESWFARNKELLVALSRIKSYFDYGLFTPIQVAAIKALDQGRDEHVSAIKAEQPEEMF